MVQLFWENEREQKNLKKREKEKMKRERTQKLNSCLRKITQKRIVLNVMDFKTHLMEIRANN